MIKPYCFKRKRSAYNLFSFMTILIVLIITSVSGFASGLSQSKQDIPNVELKWLTYDQALKKSEIENIPTLIYFYSNNCGWCRKLEDETFSNEQVKNLLNEDFAIVKINSSSSKMIMNEGKEISERQLSQKIYQVNANPTIWFLNSNGERIAPLPGYAPAEDFIIVLRYIKGDYYKEYTFPEYLENMN
jgi:thioredoxin-related protein